MHARVSSRMPGERTAASISIALAGSGGSGVMTAGTLLLNAAAKAGLYGLMVRTSGPQIRGGEAAALVRLGEAPTHGLDDRFDLLLAIDWQNVNRFADEIPLAATSVMIGDPDDGEAPEFFAAPAPAISRCRSRRRPRASPEAGPTWSRWAWPARSPGFPWTC